MSWSGNRSTGGGIVTDTKVKVDGNDLTAQYLADKLVSSDGSIVFTVLNPLGVEQYDLSVDLTPISITQADARSAIVGNTLKAGRLYLITDAYYNTCQIFQMAVKNNEFNQQGWGTFSNASIMSPVNCNIKYDVVGDWITEIYIPNTNVRIAQVNVNPSPTDGYSTTLFLNNFRYDINENRNLDVSNCTLTGGVATSLQEGWRNNIFIDCDFVLDRFVSIQQSVLKYCTILTPAYVDQSGMQACYLEACTVTLRGTSFSLNKGWSAIIEDTGSSSISGSTFMNGSNSLFNTTTFINCKIGNAKTFTDGAGGYVGTNGSLDMLDSTFEVFVDPDGLGIMNLNNYKFAGIVRIGIAGAPATFDLKEIQNYPTDHIFCIIPSTDNTVDVYDAGAGGTNIYLNTAAVVTYDGTKDDTLVVRSGLNDYFKLFQIGGWQAPSA